MQESQPVLILTQRHVARLLDLGSCITAVELAFHRHGAGMAQPPVVAGMQFGEGGFHIKAGTLETEQPYFAAKINANFPTNPHRHGLPTIQGVIVLNHAETGRVLAVIDSIEITTLRTGAATAVAVRHLAREDAAAAAIIGCGNQGRVQLRALSQVRRLSRITVYDIDRPAAERMARELSVELNLGVKVAATVAEAARGSDLIVTCTPSEAFLLDESQVDPGAFVAGVGVDSHHKRELAPGLLAGATVIVDVLEQCAQMGDLHHALNAGALRREDVHGELGQVVAGVRPVNRRPEDIVVFDSTGMALQDVAAAALVYRRALEQGEGIPVDLGGTVTRVADAKPIP